ncbi:hypothetical protein GCM10009641_47110 [Mycobacterium cookii]|uniref:Uncharacterized protein n=1 Tax=Nocardioides furvisabuli TaxID=375542 RepID=A0ABN2XRL6_9ACTN|nr:hypothetical protein [Nocardioides furvisabuli]
MAHTHIPTPQVTVSDDLWKDGLSDAAPRVGDLFVVGYDGEDYGLVLIVAVRDGHVVIWPVTDESLPTSDTCIRLEADWLDRPLVCWPEAEAGISFATLARRLGPVLEDRAAIGIYHYVRGGDLPDGVSAYEEPETDTEFQDALAMVCKFAADLSDHDSLDSGSGLGLLREAFRDKWGLKAADIHHVLHTPAPKIAADIFYGRCLLNLEEARTIASHWNAPLDLVWTEPTGALVFALKQPTLKNRIVSLAAKTATSENDIRCKVWSEVQQMAARQSDSGSSQALDSKIQHVIEQLEASI